MDVSLKAIDPGSRLLIMVLPLALSACGSSSAPSDNVTGASVSSAQVRPGATAADLAACPWLNMQLTPEKRAQVVLAAMTFDEKVSMAVPGGQAKGASAGSITGIPRLCLPQLTLVDGPNGVGDINLGVTAFPVSISQAAAFDPATQYDFGNALGAELRGTSNNVWLGPTIDIARYPLSGRTFETMGEDPFLTGETAAATIQGAQSQHVISVVKHFLGNTSEDNRTYVDDEIDDRTLHEIYLPGFEAAVQRGNAGGVMCAYNLVNGEKSCGNTTLLTKELKGRIDFRGFVVSDWIEASLLVTDATAGMDVEMPTALSFLFLGQAVQLGIVPMSRLDDMAYRVLWAHFATGLFDDPIGDPQASVTTPEHQQLARHMAVNGSVLLKNDGDLLPITQKNVTIAVVGPVGPGGAGNQCGGGGSAVVDCANSSSAASHLVGNNGPDALTAIQTHAAQDGIKVLFADGSNIADVTSVASSADYVLAFGYYTEGEGQNRRSFNLDGSGDQYIAAAAAANSNTAVILATGGPVAMPWIEDVRAVLETWYSGVEGANAIADMVFGDQSPGGRLPITFPKAAMDFPTAGSPLQQNDFSPIANFSEGLKVGYRWYDFQNIEPLFPFGHGLTYSKFTYSGLSVEKSGSSLLVSFNVRNVGARTAAAVPQLYVEGPRVGDPPQQLKGFAKVELKSGENRRVTLPLDPRSFQYWDTTRSEWVTKAGCYGLAVGSSSREKYLRTSRTPSGDHC